MRITNGKLNSVKLKKERNFNNSLLTIFRDQKIRQPRFHFTEIEDKSNNFNTTQINQLTFYE